MKYNLRVDNFVVAVVLVLAYFLLPEYAFTAPPSISQYAETMSLPGHLLHPLSHANVWHLAANVLCVLLLPCSLCLYISYPVAVLASFLPSPTLYELFGVSAAPTMGFSGVLFAAVGLQWGRVGLFRTMLYRNRWFLIVPALIPHINALLHFYCLVLAFITSYKATSACRFTGRKKNL